jgi:hypothetical protein
MHRIAAIPAAVPAAIRSIALGAALSCVHAAAADAFRYEPSDGDAAVLVQPAAVQPAAVQSDVGRSSGAPDAHEFEVLPTIASDFSGTTVVGTTFGAYWFVADDISVGVFGDVFHVNQDVENAIGAGVGAGIRWYFMRSDSLSLFADLGVGVMWFDHPVPASATSFDFSPRASFGAAYEINATTHLDARIGWLHFSNAQTGEQNPGLDLLAVGVGLSFAF